VAEIHRHPNYTSSQASIGGMAVSALLVLGSHPTRQTPETNDLALVRLKSPMEMTDYVKTIPLADSSPETGSCTTAGWGSHAVGSLVLAPPLPSHSLQLPGTVLQRLAAPLVGREECQARLAACALCPPLQVQEEGSVSAHPVQEEGLCAGGEGAGPCFGYLWADAGGPLACGDALVGVVRFIVTVGCVHQLHNLPGELGGGLWRGPDPLGEHSGGPAQGMDPQRRQDLV
jgi:hypothetical protein